jgi:Zn-dependent peptidase ImmA (M78 family)/transcriptional regulator with XRE-family HTH domain
MAEKAYITPKVLKWARESARMTEETAASKVSISVEKLQEWESGTTQPTINQAETLAKSYRRPFALFFLPEIPRDFQPLQDYRRKSAKPLGTASVFIIREIQQKQAWIHDVFEDDHDRKLSFVGKFSLKDDPRKVAIDILATLEIQPLKYTVDNPIREWIDKAESKGIFISRTSFIHSFLKLDSEEIQGFAISDNYAPFVFVNSEDWDAPQLFTLLHEIAHIWIAASGISNEIGPELKSTDNLHPVELFCNEVAANALMPVALMKDINPRTFVSATEVFKVAKRFGVSSFAFLFRAYNLGIIQLETYRSLKSDAQKEFEDFLLRDEERKLRQKEKTGGPNPYLLRLNKNSRLFTQIVLDAFHGGFIEPSLASNLLNTQVNNFHKLEAQLYK